MHHTAAAPRTHTALPRTLCALVALAAGIVGVIMLAAPRSSGRYFSWALGPPALAALVGAFYVASAIVFAWAAFREEWAGMRGLCVAVFGLSLPTLVATAHHHDTFDFSRWQALAWAVLFVASPIAFGLTLWVMRGAPMARRRRPGLRPWARAVLATMGVGYGVLALTLWFGPNVVSRHGPFAVAGLGARFAGSWAAFLALAAAYAVVRDRWDEARVPMLALAVWPLAALGAALVRLDDVRTGAPRVLYLAGLGVLAGLAASALAFGRTRAAHTLPAPRPTLAVLEPA